MHPAAYHWIRDTLKSLPKPTRVLELGSRDINGTPRALLPSTPYVGVDLVDGPGVDVVADAATYEPQAKADLVLCCEVLEHSEYAADIVRNAVACVAPGGHLLITCATTGRAPHSAVDGGAIRPGEFYRNVTVEELSTWLYVAGTRGVFAQIHSGDLYALAQVPA
jgi:methyltransferase family protein